MSMIRTRNYIVPYEDKIQVDTNVCMYELLNLFALGLFLIF